MKTILLPTDGSEVARNAIDYAIRMNQSIPCRFLMIHTYPAALHHPDMINRQIPHEGVTAEKVLEKEVAFFKEKYSDFRLELIPLCVFGFLTDVLQRVISEEKVDLIVMGTHGIDGGWKEVVGTNTWDVIQHVPCPLIMVPQDAVFKNVKQIVFAVDEKGIEGNQTVYPLAEIAIRFKATLTLLHIAKSEKQRKLQKEMAQQYHTYFSGIQHHITSVVNPDIEEGINSYIQSNLTDLLALIPRQRNLFQKLLHTSVTKKMSLHSEIPLLILQEKEE